MKKPKEALVSLPNESMWQLAQYSLHETVPVLHHRLTSVDFDKIAHKILYGPEFSECTGKWKTRTEKFLRGKTLPLVVPAIYLQGEPVNVFVILPQVGELTAKEHWGREVLLLQLDTKFMMRAFAQNR